ncbi:MAG: hypothetical protein QOK15_1209 [Nocardioidaceae bacterium]|nr:hypothetical protein [Nocardioidaceae bacterium]
MIVRIMGEGQWELDEGHLEKLNALDSVVERAVEAGDDLAFSDGFTQMLDAVRSHGRRVPDDALLDSDLILPPADATLEEVRALLTDEGLVPD